MRQNTTQQWKWNESLKHAAPRNLRNITLKWKKLHRGPCTVWLHLCGILETGKLWRQRVDQCLPAARDRSENWLKQAFRKFGGLWKCCKTRLCCWLNNSKFNTTTSICTHEIHRFFMVNYIYIEFLKNRGLFYSPSTSTSYIFQLFIHDQSRILFVLWSSTENSPKCNSSSYLPPFVCLPVHYSVIQLFYKAILSIYQVSNPSRCWKCKMNKSSLNTPLFFSL